MSADEEDRVFSWQGLFEERINGIEQEIRELKDKLESGLANQERLLLVISKVIYYDRNIMFFLDSISKSNIKNINSFDTLFIHISYRENALEELMEFAADIWVLNMDVVFDIILDIAKRWNISFNVMASYIIEKIGIVKAKEYVKRESVLKCYGSQSLVIWDSFK